MKDCEKHCMFKFVLNENCLLVRFRLLIYRQQNDKNPQKEYCDTL